MCLWVPSTRSGRCTILPTVRTGCLQKRVLCWTQLIDLTFFMRPFLVCAALLSPVTLQAAESAPAASLSPAATAPAAPETDANSPGVLERTADWIDRNRDEVRQRLQQQAHRMDHWFGDQYNPDARAHLTVFMDHSWNEYDGFDARLRLRGNVKLPNAKNRLRLVFGDDLIEEEQRLNLPTTGRAPAASKQTSLPRPSQVNDQARRDNASVALRLLGDAGRGIDTDLDLGVRSGTDIYIRGRADKVWWPEPEYRVLLGQTLRYGSKSREYARTDVQVDYLPADQVGSTLLSTYTFAHEQRDLGVSYAHRLSQTRHYWEGQDLTYGILAGGHIRDTALRLDSYGPFVSWRQPVWREWFFVRGDLNYFNDRLAHRDHHLSALLWLEAQF